MFFYNSESDIKEFDKESQIKRFRRNATSLIEYVCDYAERKSHKPVSPNVNFGFLTSRIPAEAPREPEKFKEILEDFDVNIMPGILHWHHPDNYAYFSCGNGLTNILADMLISSVGGVSFSWQSQPSATEFENKMLDWLGRALNLPKQFLFTESYGRGGGCTQPSAGEAIFSIFIAARYSALKNLDCYKYSNSVSYYNSVHPATEIYKFVCYASSEAHSSVEKAANTALIELRQLPTNENFQITGEILEKAILEDLENHRIPILFIGTAGSCDVVAIDEFHSCGLICEKYKVWFHIDAGYAGGAFILPEFRNSIIGIEFANSIHINPSEMLLGSTDFCCLYLRDVNLYKQPFTIDAAYLMKNDQHSDPNEIDYRHYGISLSRRMRSIHLYFLFCTYGIRGLQNHVKKIIKLAKYFESLVKCDERFVVSRSATIGVLCFHQKGTNKFQLNRNILRSDCPGSYNNLINMNLLYRINKSRQLHLCACIIRGQYNLRISINYEFATEDDIDRAWEIIKASYVHSLDKDWLNDNVGNDEELNRMKSNYSFINILSATSRDEYVSSNNLPLPFGPFGMHRNSS